MIRLNNVRFRNCLGAVSDFNIGAVCPELGVKT